MNPTPPLRSRVKLNRAAVSELLSLLNMTQTELAQLCGLSPSYFSLLPNQGFPARFLGCVDISP